MFGIDFFPTPKFLAEKMLEPYIGDLDNMLVLEPSAGRGDLAEVIRSHMDSRWTRDDNLHCIEIDPDLQAVLREKKFQVVGTDFLPFNNKAAQYDLIVMNPPFSEGAKHLLHAWEIVAPGGHVVSLLNAETVRNAYSKERQLLSRIIQENGSAEFVGTPFDKADRKTSVEVVIIRLQKPAKDNHLDDLFSETYMRRDYSEPGEILDENSLVRPDAVENMVRAYTEVLSLFDDVVRIKRRVRHIGSWLGDNAWKAIAENTERSGLTSSKRDTFQKAYRDAYRGTAKQLQEAAWTRLFSNLNLSKFLTSKVQQEIDRLQKEQCSMEFSTLNIYRVLDTILASRDKIAEAAIVEAFDLLTKYYKENRVYFEGWKTNEAWRVKSKFILPCVVSFGYGHMTVNWSKRDELMDLDKALCILEGLSIENIMTAYEAIDRACKNGQTRCRSTFFDIRFYKKGTAHFKFLDEDVCARFNEAAAKGKKWLPGSFEQAKAAS